MPSTKTMGAKTATVVRVEAVIAPATSPTPRIAAFTGLSPSSRQREMDSSTTMALSTNMPTPRARPPRDMMFKDTSSRNMGAKVVATEIGIARAMTRVGTTLRRKTQITSTDNRAPSSAESRTSFTAAAMKVDWSLSTAKRASARMCQAIWLSFWRSSQRGSRAFGPENLAARAICSGVPRMASRRRWATSTMLAPASR